MLISYLLILLRLYNNVISEIDSGADVDYQFYRHVSALQLTTMTYANIYLAILFPIFIIIWNF